MGDNNGDPKIPDLPPKAGTEFMSSVDPKIPDLPPRAVLSFAAYSMGLGGLALLAWVLYHLFMCGCG